MLEYFMASWSILWFVDTFFPFWYVGNTKKNLATLQGILRPMQL
jgi:hypothetical protein